MKKEEKETSEHFKISFKVQTHKQINTDRSNGNNPQYKK